VNEDGRFMPSLSQYSRVDASGVSSHGIGAWTHVQIAAYTNFGLAAGRASASGPMAEVVSNSLPYLMTQDIASLTSYLRTAPARVAPSHAAAPTRRKEWWAP
jgi:hypothetical protein